METKFSHEGSKAQKENAKVKFQNAKCKIVVWPQAMIYISSF
jgi:hypothetical protein